METLPEDQKVIELLTKLKRSNNGYPSDMLAARRQMYMKQVANVGLGLGAGAVLKNAVKGNGAGATTTVASKILEITLIAAIAIEAGTVTFLYRDRIAAFLGLTDPTPAVATQPDANNALPETVGDLQTPLVDASETPTILPTLTPGPVFAGDENPVGNTSNDTNNVSVNSTPNPGNQGNHYGLTPKPDRTRENEGNNENSEGGGNNDNNGGGGNNNNGGGNDN